MDLPLYLPPLNIELVTNSFPDEPLTTTPETASVMSNSRNG